MKHNTGGNRKHNWPFGSVVTADFSSCNRYRYSLSETWDNQLPVVMFLMMNPSIADVNYADPTLIKTGKYARKWGYGGQLIGNMHAYRSTDKERLLDVDDPVGPENDKYLIKLTDKASCVVLAYGLPPISLRIRARCYWNTTSVRT